MARLKFQLQNSTIYFNVNRMNFILLVPKHVLRWNILIVPVFIIIIPNKNHIVASHIFDIIIYVLVSQHVRCYCPGLDSINYFIHRIWYDMVEIIIDFSPQKFIIWFHHLTECHRLYTPVWQKKGQS